MKIHKNLIPSSFIDQINSAIDKYDYLDSLYLFDNGNSTLHNFIRNELTKIELFCPNISEAHIVIRCVKPGDKKISNYPHFDNYRHTFVVPVLTPQSPPFGDLIYAENYRKLPKNVYINAITKFFYQNPFTKKFIIKNLRHQFSTIHINAGEVGYFNGLTTLHYNNPVGAERRSVLIHYENPFKDSTLNKIIEYFGKLNVK